MASKENSKKGSLSFRLLGSTVFVHPLPCLGLGLHWAWVYAAMLATRKVFFPTSAVASGDSFMFVASSFGALCSTLLISGIILKEHRIDSVTPTKVLIVSGSSILGALIFFVANAIPEFGSTFVLYILAGILTGVGSGYLLMSWGLVFGLMDQQSTMSNTSLALLIAFALYYLCVGFIDYPILAITVILLPFAEGTLLVLSLKSNPATTPSYVAGIRTNRVSFFLRTGILVLIAGFALSVLRELSIASIPAETQQIDQMAILIGSLVLALLVIHIVLLSENTDRKKYSLQVPVLFVAAAVLLLLLIGDENSLLYKIILLISYFCFEVTVWSAFAWIVYHRHLSPFRVFGLGLGGLFAGQFISPISNHFVTLSGTSLKLNQVVEPIILMFILLLTTWLLSNTKDLHGLVLPLSENDSAARETTEPSGKVEAAAKLYQLSGKETEVLDLLIKGRSITYISKRLYISNNTSKTHVKRIYSKMNVHSRESLMDLVDNIESSMLSN